MNIRDLQYFKQLFQDNSFTKAANFFKVSQPTITAAIHRLENELDTQLVIRDQSHKELIFTESGKQFEKHITQILQELGTAKSEITAIKKEKVRLGLPPIIGGYYFPTLSAKMAERDLLSSLDTREDGSKSLLNKLINGHLDIALLGSAHPIEDAKLSVHLLTHKKFKIIVSPNHPLAGQKSLAFKDLKNESFIQLNERFVHSIAFQQLGRQTHTKPGIIYRTNDIQIIKGMVANNVGISFLTELAISPQDPVVALSLNDDPQPEFIIQLVYRSNHILTPVQQKIVQLLTQNKL
ncbi:LysR substrate-binding domain-containing protein [Sporolactobacillus pectinivorans]|uniref:LysR substrate-binding domain-containing protein n=1 Tax=Sporolactobacillus pectinivorans TaxID=1591408 RepID=UPI000C25A656|nr:LysR substrate-binding domain-containing protein [Sporolactobacillus pectinivorans]